jgi:hypothetical protein
LLVAAVVSSSDERLIGIDRSTIRPHHLLMANVLGRFEPLRLAGLKAYADFYGLLTDEDALTLWERTESRDIPAQLRKLAQTLPEPIPELPFRLVANIAQQAATGQLENHYLLQEATGRQDAVGLREWLAEGRETVASLAPEALGSDLLWLNWVPPRLGPPYGAGRISLDQLASVAFSFASTNGASQAGPIAALLVLLRDWASDLSALSHELGLGDDLPWRAADAAREERDLTAVWVDLETTEAELRERIDLPSSSWTILAALAALPQTSELVRIDSDELLRVVRQLAEDLPEPRGSQEDPEAPDYRARPSTTVTTDVWTDQDQLEHELYADAIASFIRDDRTLAPLTIGIKAPWGAGKTSLMRMVRKKLDPIGTTLSESKSRARSPRPSAAAKPREKAPATHPRRRPRQGAGTENGLEEPVLTNRELLRTTRLPPEAASDELGIDTIDAQAVRTTIWFNAWKYQSGEQLWAGLAHAIVSQLEQRMTRLERERFWASINIRRLDLTAVRRRIYRAFALRVSPYIIALPLFAAVTIPLWLVSGLLGATLVGVGSLGAAAHIALRWGRFMHEDVASSSPAVVSDPGYEGRLGFLHLLDDDLHRILSLVASTDRPLVVFVDDLDRCSYTTVAQVIEALNTFLAGDYDNCIFVIAMEPDLVAAQIHVAYEKLFARIEERTHEGEDLGWRFLEKMVQLPLSLPPPRQPQIERFVDSILGSAIESHVDDLEDDSLSVVAMRKEIRRAETTGTLEAIPGAMQSVRHRLQAAGDAPENLEAVLQKAARLEFVDRFSDALVRDMIVAYAAELAGNPREIKRFVNVFRFYAYVEFWRGTSIDEPDPPGLDGAAKLARLAVGWPHLLTMLGRDVTRDGRRARVLTWLEEAATNDNEWEAAVELMPQHVRTPLSTATEFRTAVARPPFVGEKAAGFL